MSEFADVLRARECKRSPDGAWLCLCGAALSDDDLTHCKACTERATALYEQRQRDQRARMLREKAEGILTRFPGWAWVDDDSLVSKRCHSARMRRAVEGWSPTDGNLVLLGPTGLGKTMLAVRRARQLVREAHAGGHLRSVSGFRWASGLELVRAHAEHPLGKGKAELLSEAFDAGILFLDEIGFEDIRAGGTLMLELFEHRYRLGRVTVVTSGATREELISRYGMATWRRMVEPKGQVVEDWGRNGR